MYNISYHKIIVIIEIEYKIIITDTKFKSIKSVHGIVNPIDCQYSSWNFEM